MHLVMFSKDREPRAGVIDGEEIVDINACDRSLPSTIKGLLKRTPSPRCEGPEEQETPPAAQSKAAPADSESGAAPLRGHELPRAPEGDEDARAGEARRVHQERREHHRPGPADPPAAQPPRHGRLGGRVHRRHRPRGTPHPAGESARPRRGLHHRQRRLGARLGGADLPVERHHGADPRLGAQPARQDVPDLLPDGAGARDPGRGAGPRQGAHRHAAERPGDANANTDDLVFSVAS